MCGRIKIIITITALAIVNVQGITPVELDRRIQSGEKLIIIDVRHNELYQKSHIPGAINIPAAICDQKRLPGTHLIVVYDGGFLENLAAEAGQKLRIHNNARIEILEGGFSAWETFV